MSPSSLPIPPFVTPSLSSTLAFSSLVLALIVGFVALVHRSWAKDPDQRRATVSAGVGLGLWMATSAVLAESGVFSAMIGSPKIVLYLVASNLVALGVALSGIGRRAVAHVPIAWLVGFQAFRVPLELILHSWYEQGTLPVQITYEGDNFDIVSGALALLVGLALRFRILAERARAMVALTNTVGFLLLLRVMSIALLSIPGPLRTYANDPPILLAFHWPYTWILPVCVSGALFGHVLVFRWLLASRERDASTGR